MVIFTISRLLRQSLLPSVLQSMIEKSIRILRQQEQRERFHIIQIQAIFLLIIQKMYLQHLTFRTAFRHVTPQERYSIPSLVKSFLIGNQQQSLFVPSLQITSFHTIPFHLPIQYAAIMAILQVRFISAHTAQRKLRYIAVLLVIIVRLRTGMQARARSMKIE